MAAFRARVLPPLHHFRIGPASWRFAEANKGIDMRRVTYAVLAVASGVLLSACESMITGGPLIRPGEPTGTIIVQNSTSGNIDVVLISECGASTYGLNRLPDNSAIAAGRSYSFTVSAGCWDVDAGAFGKGEARQRMQVAAGGGTRYTVTD
jgi:hypothetical protein